MIRQSRSQRLAASRGPAAKLGPAGKQVAGVSAWPYLAAGAVAFLFLAGLAFLVARDDSSHPLPMGHGAGDTGLKKLRGGAATPPNAATDAGAADPGAADPVATGPLATVPSPLPVSPLSAIGRPWDAHAALKPSPRPNAQNESPFADPEPASAAHAPKPDAIPPAPTPLADAAADALPQPPAAGAPPGAGDATQAKPALQPGGVRAMLDRTGGLARPGAQRPFQKTGLRADSVWEEKIRGMFLHAWKGYKAKAWGSDTLKPVSQRGDDNFLGMGATILDAMGTMLVMGERAEFEEAKAWVLTHLSFEEQENVSVFETTIRILGGLLSAWDLDGRREPRFLDQARALADKLLVAFDSPSGIPYGTVGFRSRRKFNPPWAGGGSSIAEVATLQLEFEALTAATGEPKYASAVRRVMRAMRNHEPEDSLWPMFISPDSGAFSSSVITLGARGDSTYEYLLKQWVIAGGRRGGRVGNAAMVGKDVSAPEATQEERDLMAAGASPEQAYFEMVRAMYDRSAAAVDKHLVQTCSEGEHLMYIAERHGKSPMDKMDHLVCFAGGMFALGARGQREERDMEIARGVSRTCRAMYEQTPTRLAPEISRFNNGRDIVVDPGAKHCLLRPEAVESWFYMWRATGEGQYRQWGREFAEALDKHARVETGGYTSIDDTTVAAPGRNRDHMESFFLAETLKYLYLLFTDSSVVSLDEWVFNTEAHPVRLFEEPAAEPRTLAAPLSVPFVSES